MKHDVNDNIKKISKKKYNQNNPRTRQKSFHGYTYYLNIELKCLISVRFLYFSIDFGIYNEFFLKFITIIVLVIIDFIEYIDNLLVYNLLYVLYKQIRNNVNYIVIIRENYKSPGT